jgi:hypothetical protein
MLQAIELDRDHNHCTMDLEGCNLEMGTETPDCLRYGSGQVFEDLYFQGIVIYQENLLPLFSCEMDSVEFVVKGDTVAETEEFVQQCLNAHAARQFEQGSKQGWKEARQSYLRANGLL